MNNYASLHESTTIFLSILQKKLFIPLVPKQLHKSVIQWVRKDWYTYKYLFFGLLLFTLTMLTVIAYYLNHPQVELNADTPAYLNVANGLYLHPYQLVNTWRLPGYPLLIVFFYAIAGKGNLVAVSIAQAALFIVAVLEIYVLAIYLLKHTWLAFLIGLFIGSNLILLSYIKPIMSEGLALWLFTTLIVAVVYFICTMRKRAFWFMVVCLLALIFTRPEWVYLPVLLFAYLFLATARRGMRRLISSVLIALFCIYACVGIYITANAMSSGYIGMTAIENFNWMGKVLQYQMEGEAPPEYAQVSHELDFYVARVDRDPYHVLPYLPELSKNNDVPAGQFARAIILRQPVEFVFKSVPVFFVSLVFYYDNTQGNLTGPLAWLQIINRVLYMGNICFPLCALAWLFLLSWRRTRSQPRIQAMGAIVLLVLYGLLITTLGGYRLDDYNRVHTVFNPLLMLVVWGSLGIGIHLIVTSVYSRIVVEYRKKLIGRQTV